MTEEEKKAIHDLKILRQGIGLLNCIPNVEKDEVDIKAIDIILNLIQKQDTEINKLNNVIDRMAEYIYSKTDFTTCGNIKSIKEYFMKEDK